jgi:predicted nucleic acid-binding protein
VDSRPRALARTQLHAGRVSNAIYQSTRRGEIDRAEADEALALVLAADVRLEEDAALHSAAVQLARDLGQSNTYDAHYLALAARHGVDLWTGDRRLYDAVCDRFPHIRWIGD